MFGLFSKKPDSVNYCNALANEARIDVVLEGGVCSGLIISVDVDGAILQNHLKNLESASAFIKTIESRIRKRQINDPRDADAALMEKLGLSPLDQDHLSVVRIVAGRGHNPVMQWDPQKS